MTDKTGSPAFPVWNHQDDAKQLPGMTLRDYFAAQAMQGWLSSYGPDAPHPVQNGSGGVDTARNAYTLADAMIAARGEQPRRR